MRGAILSMAVLMTAATTLALAETPPIRAFRPMPSSRVALPFTPRPATPPSVMPRMASTPARTPHCPNPPLTPPISVSMPKPDYNRRTMRLVQQNIAMMVAMRAAQAPRYCDPSWSAKTLARKGCPPAVLAPEPVLEPASTTPPLAPETTIAAAHEASAGQN